MKKGVFILILLLFTLNFSTFAQSPVLFTDTSLRDTPIKTSLTGAVRTRYAAFDPQALSHPSISLNLFPDALFTGVNTRIEPRPSNEAGYVWIGVLAGEPYSSVVLVISPQGIDGQINKIGAGFAIETVTTGVVAISEVRGHGSESDASQSPLDWSTSVMSPRGDSGEMIDVMVVYTPSAAGFGGITDKIDSMLTVTNNTYVNSGIQHRLRLVHSRQVKYTEAVFSENPSNMTIDLRRLTYLKGERDAQQNIYDPVGYLDGVHSLRNQYGADLVVLLVNDTQAQGIECGSSWIAVANPGNIVALPKFGFSVVNIQCWTPYYFFAHHIGHMMGGHDGFQSDLAVFPYAFGHQDPTQEFSTIMASPYNDACPLKEQNQGFIYCTPIGYWSNPDQEYNGKALGSATANMVSTLNQTAPVVANFRLAILEPALLLEPLNNAIIIDPTVTFRWKRVANANQYTIRLSTASGYVYKTTMDCFEPECQWTPDATFKPPYGQALQWNVRARTDDGRTSLSETWTIVTDFLPKPALTTPQSIVNDKDVVFTWESDTRVDDFYLRLLDPNGIVVHKQWYAVETICADSQCTVALDMTAFVPKAVQNGVYQWQFRARRDEVTGFSRTKGTFTFKLTVSTLTPAHQTSVPTGTVQQFSWNENDTLTEYRLRFVVGTEVIYTTWRAPLCVEGICTRPYTVKFAPGSVRWFVEGRSARLVGVVSSTKKILQLTAP